MADYTDYSAAVETMSGGTNKVILDDIGLPSIMVAFPKLKYSDVFSGELATDETLPAFIVGGVEKDVVWVSKYQNVVVNGRAYSLPSKDLKTSITFDTSVNVCRQKGNGWALMPNSVWAAIQNWCLKNETVPHGNGNYGSDSTANYEKGIPSTKETSGLFRTLSTKTGSGPYNWYHNHDYAGISDLVGNGWEWVSGLRTVYGEIQIIPNADAIMAAADLSLASSLWKAVLPNGNLVPLSTDGSLKFDGVTSSGGLRINTTKNNTTTKPSGMGYEQPFANLIPAAGVTIPAILIALGISPIDNTTYGIGNIRVNNALKESPAIRGGDWRIALGGSIFHLSMTDPRTTTSSVIGFRSVYCG